MAVYLHVLSGLNYDYILIITHVLYLVYIVHAYLCILIHCLGVTHNVYVQGRQTGGGGWGSQLPLNFRWGG